MHQHNESGTRDQYIDVKMTPEEYARFLAAKELEKAKLKARSPQRYIGGIIAILGAILVVIGSVLPWAEHPYENISQGGLETYGKYSLVAAIIIVAAAVIFMLMEKATWGQILGCIAGAGACIAALWKFVDKTVFVSYNVFGKAIGEVSANTSFGVYLVFAGAVIAILGSIAADIRLR